jgi:hypothetical protein
MIWVTLSDGVALRGPETIMNNSLAAEDGVGLMIVFRVHGCRYISIPIISSLALSCYVTTIHVCTKHDHQW